MVRYFCDRCGKEKDQIRPVRIIAPRVYSSLYELCDECIDRLKVWLENEEEKEDVDEK